MDNIIEIEDDLYLENGETFYEIEDVYDFIDKVCSEFSTDYTRKTEVFYYNHHEVYIVIDDGFFVSIAISGPGLGYINEGVHEYIADWLKNEIVRSSLITYEHDD